ncbi:hypothetical protein [Streptomyces sp. NPDC048172]|uniref:hypothetical protein n=1 Tax=Streptomyces sp. NPDC048172 TaxID=3365505 RepID=UPI00370FEF6A
MTYDPFPPLPADVHEYLLAVIEEGGPLPWDLGAIPTSLADSVLPWLATVVRWLNTTYAWQPHQLIPPCWRQHDHLTYELAALAFARTDAYRDPGAVPMWREQYDRFLSRTATSLGANADQCRMGRHQDRPARYHLAVWPDEPSTS